MRAIPDKCVKFSARAEDETTARVANFTRVGSVLPRVLHTILFMIVHGMYGLKRPRTDAECKFFSKCTYATGSFISLFDVRMRNSTFHVLFLILSLRPPHMGGKSYIPCVCHEKLAPLPLYSLSLFNLKLHTY